MFFVQLGSPSESRLPLGGSAKEITSYLQVGNVLGRQKLTFTLAKRLYEHIWKNSWKKWIRCPMTVTMKHRLTWCPRFWRCCPPRLWSPSKALWGWTECWWLCCGEVWPSKLALLEIGKHDEYFKTNIMNSHFLSPQATDVCQHFDQSKQFC